MCGIVSAPLSQHFSGHRKRMIMILICEETRLRMNWGNNVSLLSLQPDDGGEEEMRGSVQDPLCAYRWFVADGILTS